MVENPPTHQRAQSVDWTHEASSRSSGGLVRIRRNRNSPYPSSDEDVESSANQNQIECTGQNCKSCTATVVADCVAICCCPCAVVNFLTLTLVKVPFTMGRRCLRLVKKKCIVSTKKGRRKGNNDQVQNCKEKWLAPLEALEVGDIEIQVGSTVVNGPENFCARVEAERVWLEFYQVGHLGFGRVSFTGIPAKG